MIWADDKAQEGEIVILEDFLKKHVKHINQLAGYEVLTYDDARNFTISFLETRPDKMLLSLLRSYVAPVRLKTAPSEQKELFEDSLLAACIDIASSSVVKYPYGIHERFDSKEKKCFFEILETIK